MKRIHILTKPTSVSNLADLDSDSIANDWQIRAERLQIKQLRKFRHQWI